ncbi:MAG: DUF6263 family protein [Planctomycetota bacterium]|jgi:hypothetical protein
MLRKKYPLALSVAVLAIAVGTSCGPSSEENGGPPPLGDLKPTGEKIELRLRFKEGDSIKQKMITDQQIVQTIQGQKQDMQQAMEMGMTQDVEKVNPDGSARIKVTYHSVKMVQQAPPPVGKIEYDSANPPANVHPMAAGMAALVGQSFTIEMTPEGTVTKVEGADEMLERIAEQVPAGGAMVKEQLKKQFGDEALKQMMEKVTAIYPDNPVDIGDSWNTSIEVTTGFPISMENTYTLIARRDGVAVLDVRSTVKGNPNAKPIEMGPMKIKYNLSGSQYGETEIDEATGWPVKSTMKQDLSGQVEMIGGPAAMSPWPISIKSDIRVVPDEG